MLTLRTEEADAIVQKCADFAREVILRDRIKTEEKPRNHSELAALVYNSLVHMKSSPNTALPAQDA